MSQCVCARAISREEDEKKQLIKIICRFVDAWDDDFWFVISF